MKNIRILRKKSGMTQAELASRLHVHQTAVSQWEKGRTVPDIEQMKEMAVLFEVSMECIADIQAIPFDEAEKPSENGEPKATVLDMCNDHEKTLIEAYRNNPGMQGAVDRLLGIENNDRVLLYEAASSDDYHKDRYITKDKKEWAKIEGAPDTDDPLV